MLREMEAVEEGRETPAPPQEVKQQKKKKREERLGWTPKHVEPVLEEQPKWLLLADVLDEIENDMHWAPIDPSPFFFSFFSSYHLSTQKLTTGLFFARRLFERDDSRHVQFFRYVCDYWRLSFDYDGRRRWKGNDEEKVE